MKTFESNMDCLNARMPVDIVERVLDLSATRCAGHVFAFVDSVGWSR